MTLISIDNLPTGPFVPPPEGTVAERRRGRYVAVRLSAVPEHLRSPWGTDSDQIVAVLADGESRWRML